MKTSEKVLGLLSVVSIVTIAVTLLFIAFKPVTRETSVPIGSVAQGSEYHATTTSTGRFTVPALLNTGYGTLGSVVITGAATGIINIYDATTTNITLRASTQATSSILIATFPASTAAGTFTFDQIYQRGLIVDSSGNMPTTTITYR